MCGLVGGVGELNIAKHRDAVNTMLIFDVVRGHHSTGVAFVKRDGEAVVVKKLGNPFELLDSREYDKEFSKYDNWAMIGHNRWATKGKINRVNAHPFQFDNVVGAHNGTLRSVTNLRDWKDFEVDSENVMWNVECEGIHKTLPKLQGAYALTIYDGGEESLYLARNKERPLYFCYTKDAKTLFWASEEWMLTVALKRAKVEHNQIFELREGNLMRIERAGKDGKLRTSFRPFEMHKPVVAAVNNYVTGGKTSPKPQETVEFTVDGFEKSQYGSNKYIVGTSTCKDSHEIRIYAPENGPVWKLLMESVNAFKGNVTSSGIQGGVKIKYVQHTTVQEVEYKVVDDLPDMYAHPNGSLINAEEWKKLCDDGCSWCHRLLNDDDAGELGLYLESVVCPKCATDLKVA